MASDPAALLVELFVDNVDNEQEYLLTPLNAEKRSATADNTGQETAKRDARLTARLHEINANAAGHGITREMYETHGYEIRSFARDVTSQRWWGSGLDYKCDLEDRVGRRPTAEQLRRFPNDGGYGSLAADRNTQHTNIFDTPEAASDWEGTLFHDEYSNGTLARLRIFHQGHRNGLRITSTTGGEILDAIESRLHQDQAENTPSDPAFALTREDYRARIDTWNARYGTVARIEMMTTRDGDEEPIMLLSENPHAIAQWFRETIPNDTYGHRGPLTYVIGDKNAHGYADLFLRRHLDGSLEAFDFEKDREEPTAILPHVQPAFTIPLIVAYVSDRLAKSKQSVGT